jgi:nucleotide-binding universal stress UspA family protein
MSDDHTTNVEERMCVYCGKNPIPYLKDDDGNSIGIQSTLVDNCNQCSNERNGFEIVKRGVKKGQKLQRNRYYRVVVVGGIDEQSGEQKVMYEQEHKRFDREALKDAKTKLKELGGRYSTVYMIDRSTDQQFVVARFEWETVRKVVKRGTPRLLKERVGD